MKAEPVSITRSATRRPPVHALTIVRPAGQAARNVRVKRTFIQIAHNAPAGLPNPDRLAMNTSPAPCLTRPEKTQPLAA